MTANDARERIKSRVWKAIAQSELDLGALPAAEVEDLVDLVTEAAILEIDKDMDHQTEADQTASEAFYPPGDSDEEQTLWKGRPLLSISEHYLITNERVRIVRGLLGKDRLDIELIRVQDIDHSQTLRERALNVGDITIRSHDRSHPTIVLNMKEDYRQWREQNVRIDTSELQRLGDVADDGDDYLFDTPGQLELACRLCDTHDGDFTFVTHVTPTSSGEQQLLAQRGKNPEHAWSLLLAARTRTSTAIAVSPPTREISPLCRARSTLACALALISPISSRKRVPPLASSNIPFLRPWAPVNAPRS